MTESKEPRVQLTEQIGHALGSGIKQVESRPLLLGKNSLLLGKQQLRFNDGQWLTRSDKGIWLDGTCLKGAQDFFFFIFID